MVFGPYGPYLLEYYLCIYRRNVIQDDSTMLFFLTDGPK